MLAHLLEAPRLDPNVIRLAAQRAREVLHVRADDGAAEIALVWSRAPLTLLPGATPRASYRLLREVGGETGAVANIGRYRVAPADVDACIAWQRTVQDSVLALGGLTRHRFCQSTDDPTRFLVVAEYADAAARERALRAVASAHTVERLDVTRFHGAVLPWAASA